ncbi:MAG TPA: N-acetylmuramoyl-L-alanine amidase [Polyangiales bacterium]|nr:N-acetylmuramoyl-L-alanine amidase [Polyangiales bacterium]
MAYSLLWLPDVLEGAGLKVAEVDGWQMRGRGDVGELKGVLCHHTVGPAQGNMPSLKVLTHGRAGLNGPLAQLGLGRDGTYYVIAAGLANHAGKGQWNGLLQGNKHLLGLEVENTGRRDDVYPDVQLDAYRRGVAAILKFAGLEASCCLGHKEWAGRRKIDPLFDMDAFRTSLASGTNAPLIPAKDKHDRRTLRRGDRGEDVRRLQKALTLALTGEFDGVLEAAVRAFQRAHPPLVPDGIVGPKSWAVLPKEAVAAE